MSQGPIPDIAIYIYKGIKLELEVLRSKTAVQLSELGAKKVDWRRV